MTSARESIRELISKHVPLVYENEKRTIVSATMDANSLSALMDDIEAALQQARVKALEEAAQLVNDVSPVMSAKGELIYIGTIADQIRALTKYKETVDGA